MSLVKYLFKTNYKQKKQDWAEYQDLKKLLVQTKEEVKSKRSALHETSYLLDDLIPMNKEYCFTTVIDIVGDYLHRNVDRNVHRFNVECEHFVNNEHCSQQQCCSCKLNHEYVDLYNRTDKLRQEVDEFWMKKFARVK